MGNYLQIFRRRKPPSEELDKLVLHIGELESQLKQLLDAKAWSLKWITVSAFFAITTMGAYCWNQGGAKRKFISILAPVSIGCLVFVTIRFASKTVFDWFIRRKQERILSLTGQKVAIIEQVKENEKFKVAKEIIEKYGSEMEVSEWLAPSSSKPKSALKKNISPKNSLKFANKEGDQFAIGDSAKSVPKLYEIRDSARPLSSHRTPVRPFVEPSRSPFDRVLDFVMGESINNRYALICANCHSHNGMALREEFEIISYYCFRVRRLLRNCVDYSHFQCNFFNPSKAEVIKRLPRFQMDFTGHTDESTENEVESERKASTASLNTEVSEDEAATLGK